jgi:uncharacterized protein (TIGR00661 family)
MNLLVGICGVGYGHSIRQTTIVHEALRRGHQVLLFCDGCSDKYYRSTFPLLPRYRVCTPWIHATNAGIDFAQTAADERNRRQDQVNINYSAMEEVTRFLGTFPDLVISDYEPISAQYAYATNRPLVTIDNQSKFLGFTFPDVNGLTRAEQRARLSLFFPKAARRYATSFFTVPWNRDPEYDVTLVPPIVRESVLRSNGVTTDTVMSPSIVVYLSRLGTLAHDESAFIDILRSQPSVHFSVFSDHCATRYHHTNGNINLHAFSEASFLPALRSSSAVITTAGHNVLSEVILLKKPVLAVPLQTFEQQHNAQAIVRAGCGLAVDYLTETNLAEFIQRLPDFNDRICRSGGQHNSGIDYRNGPEMLGNMFTEIGL